MNMKKLTEQERTYAVYGQHNAAQCWANNYEFALYCHARVADMGMSPRALEGLRCALESMTNWAELHAEWTGLLAGDAA